MENQTSDEELKQSGLKYYECPICHSVLHADFMQTWNRKIYCWLECIDCHESFSGEKNFNNTDVTLRDGSILKLYQYGKIIEQKTNTETETPKDTFM